VQYIYFAQDILTGEMIDMIDIKDHDNHVDQVNSIEDLSMMHNTPL